MLVYQQISEYIKNGFSFFFIGKRVIDSLPGHGLSVKYSYESDEIISYSRENKNWIYAKSRNSIQTGPDWPITGFNPKQCLVICDNDYQFPLFKPTYIFDGDNIPAYFRSRGPQFRLKPYKYCVFQNLHPTTLLKYLESCEEEAFVYNEKYLSKNIKFDI